MKSKIKPFAFTITLSVFIYMFSHDLLSASADVHASLWVTPLCGVTFNISLSKKDLRNLKENWKANSVWLKLINGDLRQADPPYTIQRDYLENIELFLDWCEELEIQSVIDIHKSPGRLEWQGEKDRRLWSDYQFHDLLDESWAVLAEHYAKQRDVIAGYDLFNEPNMDMQILNTPIDWNALAKRLTKTIHQYDMQHGIIVEKNQWGSATGIEELLPKDDDHAIYSFHFNVPHFFTLQNVYEKFELLFYPGEIQGKYSDKTFLDEVKPVIKL